MEYYFAQGLHCSLYEVVSGPAWDLYLGEAFSGTHVGLLGPQADADGFSRLWWIFRWAFWEASFGEGQPRSHPMLVCLYLSNHMENVG